MLLFDEILNKVSNEEKKSILTEHIDDLYSTISRQAFFTLFEIAVHKKIGEGATVEDISNEVMKTLKEQFSNSIDLTDDFGVEWSCIPHFYHSPFYCYAYSFGNLLALSLYHQFKSEQKESFIPKYLSILSAGGSRKSESLLKEAGIDVTDDEFWQQGFDLVSEKVEELKGALK